MELRFFGYTTNLHALGDVYLPAGFIRDWQAYADAQLGNIDEHQRQLWSSSDAPQWAAESQRLAHSHAYIAESSLGVSNRSVVEQRLRQGGVRLAVVLNRALGE